VQLKSELIELEFVGGLDNFSFLGFLSLSGSLSLLDFLSFLSLVFSLSGSLFLSLSDFDIDTAAISMLCLAIFALSTAEAMALFLVHAQFAAFTSALGDLDIFSLSFLFLDGRVGSRSASFASSSSFRTLVVEEVFNALSLDLEAHFLSEFRKLVSVDVLSL